MHMIFSVVSSWFFVQCVFLCFSFTGSGTAWTCRLSLRSEDCVFAPQA